jgi:hypothetical protein
VACRGADLDISGHAKESVRSRFELQCLFQVAETPDAALPCSVRKFVSNNPKINWRRYPRRGALLAHQVTRHLQVERHRALLALEILVLLELTPTGGRRAAGLKRSFAEPRGAAT